MLDVVATLLVFFLVVEPLLVGLHELGHALVPLARGESAFVALGGESGHDVALGPLTLTVAPIGLLVPITYGRVATDAPAGRRAVVAGALAGPATSLLLMAGAGLALHRGLASPWRALATLAFTYLWFQALFTLLPVRYPSWLGGYSGVRSDGRIALDALLGREPERQ